MKKTTVVILISLTFLPFSLLAIRANFYFSRVCVGSETKLINTSTPSDSIYRVMWDLDGDGVFDDDNRDTVIISFSYAGAYNIGLKIIAINGDQDAIYKSVPVASLQVAFSQDYSCRNLPVHFFDESIIIQDTAFQYIWDFGDGSPKSYQKNPTHNYNLAAEYSVSLILISTSGCIDSTRNSIAIQNPPLIDILFSGDTIFPYGDTLIATIIGFDSLLWDNGDTINSRIITETGNYWVKAFLNGCYNEKYFSATAVVDHEVRIMSVITPNADGFNDLWEILNIVEIEPCNVEIYNRWGEKVFSASPYNNNWDGTNNGKPLSNDTYYYFLRCKDGNLQTGTINIVR